MDFAITRLDQSCSELLIVVADIPDDNASISPLTMPKKFDYKGWRSRLGIVKFYCF